MYHGFRIIHSFRTKVSGPSFLDNPVSLNRALGLKMNDTDAINRGRLENELANWPNLGAISCTHHGLEGRMTQHLAIFMPES